MIIMLHGVQHRVMFNRRCNDMFTTQVTYCRKDRGIVALRAPAGKEDLTGVCVQQFCNRFTCGFNSQPGFPAIRVDRGRVATMRGHIGQHGIHYFGIHGRGSRVVKINPVHHRCVHIKAPQR